MLLQFFHLTPQTVSLLPVFCNGKLRLLCEDLFLCFFTLRTDQFDELFQCLLQLLTALLGRFLRMRDGERIIPQLSAVYIN